MTEWVCSLSMSGFTTICCKPSGIRALCSTNHITGEDDFLMYFNAILLENGFTSSFTNMDYISNVVTHQFSYITYENLLFLSSKPMNEKVPKLKCEIFVGKHIRIMLHN